MKPNTVVSLCANTLSPQHFFQQFLQNKRISSFFFATFYFYFYFERETKIKLKHFSCQEELAFLYSSLVEEEESETVGAHIPIQYSRCFPFRFLFGFLVNFNKVKVVEFFQELIYTACSGCGYLSMIAFLTLSFIGKLP